MKWKQLKHSIYKQAPNVTINDNINQTETIYSLQYKNGSLRYTVLFFLKLLRI